MEPENIPERPRPSPACFPFPALRSSLHRGGGRTPWRRGQASLPEASVPLSQPLLPCSLGMPSTEGDTGGERGPQGVRPCPASHPLMPGSASLLLQGAPLDNAARPGLGLLPTLGPVLVVQLLPSVPLASHSGPDLSVGGAVSEAGPVPDWHPSLGASN